MIPRTFQQRSLNDCLAVLWFASFFSLNIILDFICMFWFVDFLLTFVIHEPSDKFLQRSFMVVFRSADVTFTIQYKKVISVRKHFIH